MFDKSPKILYPLHNLKKRENPHGGVLLLVKLQASWNSFMGIFHVF